MRLLNEMEENEKLQLHTRKLRNFHKEINDTYDRNLDNVLDKFIDKNDLEGSEIEHWLRRYNQILKNNK